jgi:heme/copper-type cytochrome/quinol oxidase subunit 1
MGEHESSGERRTPKPAQVFVAVLPVAGLVAVVVGFFVAWSNATSTIGWFAYAPLNNQLFLGNGMAFVSQGTQIGLAVAVAGLLVLAFCAGYRIGRRTPKDQITGRGNE